jgi:hypothetical protein
MPIACLRSRMPSVSTLLDRNVEKGFCNVLLPGELPIGRSLQGDGTQQ